MKKKLYPKTKRIGTNSSVRMKDGSLSPHKVRN